MAEQTLDYVYLPFVIRTANIIINPFQTSPPSLSTIILTISISILITILKPPVTTRDCHPQLVLHSSSSRPVSAHRQIHFFVDHNYNRTYLLACLDIRILNINLTFQIFLNAPPLIPFIQPSKNNTPQHETTLQSLTLVPPHTHTHTQIPKVSTTFPTFLVFKPKTTTTTITVPKQTRIHTPTN
ncbi:hypothetical protein BD289DRAFT_475599 [Coniella lustricola]|uniref:Uncharacterized protein n=1 Tax=Coniella lustricola TaxID=2025994 RepID=A0A2T3A2B5_9PEZI|nr:hypothetical protein BD289DRAFT_475599 [Coniella lustricola]